MFFDRNFVRFCFLGPFFSFSKRIVVYFGTVPKCVNVLDLKQILQSEYVLAKIGFDTDENEPSTVWYSGI